MKTNSESAQPQRVKLRKALLITVAVLCLLGLSVFMIALFSTLSPSGNGKVEGQLPRIDVSNLLPGHYSIYRVPELAYTTMNFENQFMVYRKLNGELRVWQVPTDNGKVGMPDLYWWRPFYRCENFGPTMINGLVDESQPMRCHDQKLPSEAWGERWQWDLNGNALKVADQGKLRVDDMLTMGGSVEGKYFVFMMDRFN